jgi:hypothetical protein
MKLTRSHVAVIVIIVLLLLIILARTGVVLPR